MVRQIEAIAVFGDVVRVTRVRLYWSQRELSRRSGVPQSRISLIERRAAVDIRLGEIEALCRALAIEYRLDFRTPDVVARPSDLVHARCCAHVGRRLSAMGWRVAHEVEVGMGRSRGWIDVLAFDDRTQTLLIVEVKTELHDIGELERTLAWYERSAWSAARSLGWRPRRIGVALLLLHTEVNDAATQTYRGAPVGVSVWSPRPGGRHQWCPGDRPAVVRADRPTVRSPPLAPCEPG